MLAAFRMQHAAYPASPHSAYPASPHSVAQCCRPWAFATREGLAIRGNDWTPIASRMRRSRRIRLTRLLAHSAPHAPHAARRKPHTDRPLRHTSHSPRAVRSKQHIASAMPQVQHAARAARRENAARCTRRDCGVRIHCTSHFPGSLPLFSFFQ